MRTIQNSILLLLFCTFSSIAQENDFQTWYSVSSTIDFNVILVPDQLFTKTNRKGSITFKQGYRLRENSSLLSKQFSDFRDTTSENSANASSSAGVTSAQFITSDATLTVLSNHNNPIVEFRFKDMFPVSIGELSYDQGATDVDYIRVDASFQYQQYTIHTLI